MLFFFGILLCDPGCGLVSAHAGFLIHVFCLFFSRFISIFATTHVPMSSDGLCAFSSLFLSTRLTRSSPSCSSTMTTTMSTLTVSETAMKVRYIIIKFVYTQCRWHCRNFECILLGVMYFKKEEIFFINSVVLFLI